MQKRVLLRYIISILSNYLYCFNNLCMYTAYFMYHLNVLYVVNVECKQLVSRKPYTACVSTLNCSICV